MNNTPHVVEIGSLWDRAAALWAAFRRKPERTTRFVVRDVTAALMALEPTDGPLSLILSKKKMEHSLLTGVAE